MSLVFRTQNWLTVDQLTCNWGRELAGDQADPNERARELECILVNDIVNGRLDDSGPLRNDGRSVRCITPDNKGGFVDGHQVLELTRSEPGMYLVRHRVVI